MWAMRAMRDIRARPLRRVVRLVVLAAMERGLGSLGRAVMFGEGERERVFGGLCFLSPSSPSANVIATWHEVQVSRNGGTGLFPPPICSLSHSPALCPHSPSNSRECQFAVWKCGILRLGVGVVVDHRSSPPPQSPYSLPPSTV